MPAKKTVAPSAETPRPTIHGQPIGRVSTRSAILSVTLA